MKGIMWVTRALPWQDRWAALGKAAASDIQSDCPVPWTQPVSGEASWAEQRGREPSAHTHSWGGVTPTVRLLPPLPAADQVLLGSRPVASPHPQRPASLSP